MVHLYMSYGGRACSHISGWLGKQAYGFFPLAQEALTCVDVMVVRTDTAHDRGRNSVCFQRLAGRELRSLALQAKLKLLRARDGFCLPGHTWTHRSPAPGFLSDFISGSFSDLLSSR